MSTPRKERPNYGSASTEEGIGLVTETIEVEDEEVSFFSRFTAYVCRLIKLPSLSVIFNTMNALLGVSIFAMPWGFAMSGLIGGFLIVLGVGALAFHTVQVLLKAQRALYQRTGEVKSFPDIAAHLLGEPWGPVVKVATIVSCLGCCTSYIIFFGEVCGQIFGLSFEHAAMTAIVPLILLSWIRTFRELSVFTLLGVLSIVAAVVLIISDGYHNYGADGGGEVASLDAGTAEAHQWAAPRGLSTLDAFEKLPGLFLNTTGRDVGSGSGLDDDDVPGVSRGGGALVFGNTSLLDAGATSMHGGTDFVPLLLPTLLRFIGPATFIFTIHYCVLAMGEEVLLEDPWSTLNATAVSHSSDSGGDGGGSRSPGSAIVDNCRPVHGRRVSPDSTTHCDDSTGAAREVQLVEDEKVEGAVDADVGATDVESAPLLQPRSEAGTTVSDALCGATTAGEDPLSFPLGLSFALSSVIICLLGAAGFLLYRGAPFVRDGDGQITPGCEHAVCENIVLNVRPGPVRTAVGVSLCIGIVLSYSVMLIPAREHVEPALMHCLDTVLLWVLQQVGRARDGGLPSTVVLVGTLSGRNVFYRRWAKNCIRSGLVLLTLFIAFATPNFGSVLGTVGGLTDSLQSFVLPPLMHLSVQSGRLGCGDIAFYRCIVAWGVVIMVYTVVTALTSEAEGIPVVPV